MFLLQAVREGLFLCLFWLLGATSFLDLHHITPTLVSLSCFLLWSFYLPLIRTLVVTLGPPGYSRIISPSLGSSLNHICKIPLPCKIPQSQVQGLGRDHLVGHDSAHHKCHPLSIFGAGLPLVGMPSHGSSSSCYSSVTSATPTPACGKTNDAMSSTTQHIGHSFLQPECTPASCCGLCFLRALCPLCRIHLSILQCQQAQHSRSSRSSLIITLSLPHPALPPLRCVPSHCYCFPSHYFALACVCVCAHTPTFLMPPLCPATPLPHTVVLSSLDIPLPT